jgi:hypothetical protein
MKNCFNTNQSVSATGVPVLSAFAGVQNIRAQENGELMEFQMIIN